MYIARGLLGIVVLLAIAWIFSENKRKVNLRLVVVGVLLQFVLAGMFFHVDFCRDILDGAVVVAKVLDEATEKGTSFTFGYVGGESDSGKLPFELTNPHALGTFALRYLPMVIVVSAICSALFYLRILPWFLQGVGWALRKTMRVGACESLAMAANIIFGQTESPLLVAPYLQRMSRSEIFAVMSGGMATIAGTVLMLYASVLGTDSIPHLLVASIISAPAAFVIAKIMIPMETDPVPVEIGLKSDASGFFDSLTIGTTRGLKLWLNIVAMLIVFVALIHIVNASLGVFPEVNGEPISLERVFGWIFAPLAWILGVDWEHAPITGELLGIKVVANEFLAYLHLAENYADVLKDRNKIITIYAMCGFANFGSAGIMGGAMVTLIPQRRAEIAELSFRAIISGFLATCLTGAIAGMLFNF